MSCLRDEGVEGRHCIESEGVYLNFNEQGRKINRDCEGSKTGGMEIGKGTGNRNFNDWTGDWEAGTVYTELTRKLMRGSSE